MQTVIYLVRHGAYKNPRKILHLRLRGFPLSREGITQSNRLANILKGKPITVVYSSPLARAIQTAKIIAAPHHLRVVKDDRLLDIRSPLQGKSVTYMESVKWNFYRPEFIKAGGERLSEIFKRTDSFIREKMKQHQGQQIVAISHGDPMMVIKVKYLGGRLSRKSTKKDYVPMAGGYQITHKKNDAVPSFTPLPM